MLTVAKVHNRLPVVVLHQKKSGRNSPSFGRHLIIPLMSMFCLGIMDRYVFLFGVFKNLKLLGFQLWRIFFSRLLKFLHVQIFKMLWTFKLESNSTSARMYAKPGLSCVASMFLAVLFLCPSRNGLVISIIS
jgi:hypothetical protein